MPPGTLMVRRLTSSFVFRNSSLYDTCTLLLLLLLLPLVPPFDFDPSPALMVCGTKIGYLEVACFLVKATIFSSRFFPRSTRAASARCNFFACSFASLFVDDDDEEVGFWLLLLSSLVFIFEFSVVALFVVDDDDDDFEFLEEDDDDEGGNDEDEDEGMERD